MAIQVQHDKDLTTISADFGDDYGKALTDETRAFEARCGRAEVKTFALNSQRVMTTIAAK